MLRKIIFLSNLFLVLAITEHSQAFPEMVRMGYVNCTACHVSPSGGGLLTDYGRSAASEVLSTWAYSKEELVGHGLLPETPAWLKVGGDVRSIQIYVDTPRDTTKSFFPMQADLETGLNFGRLWLVQAFGVQGGPDGAPYKGQFMSHHFYALYNLSDEAYIRAGKYFIPYGITLPDHTSFVRRNLGFDENQENYNLDVGTIGENWNGILTFSFGRKDMVPTPLEKGVTLQVAKNIGDTHKISGSFAYLKSDGGHRYLAGPAILWGFSPQWAFIGEYDYQEKSVEGALPVVTKGAVTYSRLQYEWFKGFHSYLLHQLSYLDFTQLRTRVSSAGVGLLFYPRPHFEFGLELDSQKIAEIEEQDTIGWFLLHYYL
jgi:hypothetical protein